MVINYTMNDNTQIEILKHLKITAKLLKMVSENLSNRECESKIIAMPDLGIAQNSTRMNGGFYTGAYYSWDCDIPFIPVDATVNVCGTAVYKLNKNISSGEFKKRLDNVIKDKSVYIDFIKKELPIEAQNSIDYFDKSKFFWNYNVGNHFAILAEQKDDNYQLPVGQYMIVHASAIEFKKDNMSYGLYPIKGNWFYDDIEEVKYENRYLRYIKGEKAIKFYKIASFLKDFNKLRNQYFCKAVLGNLLEDEILNVSHYGMPDINSICIGCQWDKSLYTLLTSEGHNIYLVNPSCEGGNTFVKNDTSITLTPHGCGTMLKNESDKIVYTTNGLIIGDKYFKNGEKINIGSDVIVRTSNLDYLGLNNYINNIIDICPGLIIGNLEQIYAKTKNGDFDYSKQKKLVLK